MHRSVRGLAAAVIAAGILVGTAGVASADPVELNPCGPGGHGADLLVDGHYVRGCVYP
jgi:hypothetical protein